MVRKPHGVQGGLKVTLTNINLDTLGDLEQFFVKSGNNWTQLTLKSLQGYADYAIIRFNEIKDRTAAETLRNLLIYTDRDALPALPDGEIFRDGLIGCRVEGEHNTPLGIVEDVLTTGAHHILIVKQGEDELMIPLVDEWVTLLDTEKKYIQVRTAEEL